jgi:hypothetical protein
MTRAGDGSSNALLLRHWFDGMDTDASALVPTYNNQVRLEVAGAIGVTIWIVIYGYILKA